jgi:hypothetical protein
MAALFRIACVKGDLNTVMRMHQQGHNIDDQDGIALWLAAYHNRVDVVDYLLTSGASLGLLDAYEVASPEVSTLFMKHHPHLLDNLVIKWIPEWVQDWLELIFNL